MHQLTIAVVADSSDEALAAHHAAAMSQAGMQVQPLVGQPFAAPVRTHIYEALVVVLVLSPAALASSAWLATAEFAVYVATHLPTRTVILLTEAPMDVDHLPPFLQSLIHVSAARDVPSPVLATLGLVPVATNAAPHAERLRWGTVWLAQGRGDDALALFASLTTADATDADAWLMSGIALAERERHDEALAAFAHALALRPTASTVLRYRALTLHALHRYDEALATNDAALHVEPDDPFTLVNRAHVFHDLRRYDEALTSLLMALDIIPDFHKALSLAVDTLDHMRLPARRHEYLQRLIAAAPTWPTIPLWEVTEAFAAGRTAEGLAFADAAIANNPQDEQMWRAKITQLLRQRDYQTALQVSTAALDVLPGKAILLTLQGIALAGSGRTKEALHVYRTAIQRDPRLVPPLVNAANILRKQRLFDEARGLIEQALRLAPEDVDANNAMAVLLIDQGRADDALSIIDRALLHHAQSVYLWNNRGWALLRLGRYEEALPALDRAVTLDPTYTAAWQNKAFALSRLGRQGEAMVAQGRASSLDPQAYRRRMRRQWQFWFSWACAIAILLVLFAKLFNLLP